MEVKKYLIETEEISAEIIPALGGRIESLIYKPSGKNWVWKNDKIKATQVPTGSNYDQNWQGGWEELFPNDAIEDFSWGKGYDHGELWSASWKIKKLDENKLCLETKNLTSGTEFFKSISVSESKINVKYTGRVNFEDYFLFKLHLAIPVDNKLSFKLKNYEITPVDKKFGNILENNNHSKFFNLEKDTGLYDFGYINKPTKELTIEDKNKNKLKLSYDIDNLKYLWIFQSQGGWMGHNVVVIEPCTNGRKSLKAAVSENMSIKGPINFETNYSVELS
tara:strand:- start:180 stop:1013 length:834 start_codon:yes stop_codon:yes gene_type:complete